MLLHRAAALVGFVALTASLLVMPAASGRSVPGGRGTSHLHAVAAHFSLPGGLDARVVETTADVTFDPDDAMARHAHGRMGGLTVEGPEGFALTFPDPPIESETRAGTHEESEGETGFAVPPQRLRADADEVVETAVRAVNDMAMRHRPTGVSEDLDEGAVATGLIRPARLVTTVDGDDADVVADSEVADLRVLDGVSTFESIGPGDHRSRVGTDEAAATARSLEIGSATILETGAALSLLGVDASAIPNTDLAELAEALGLLPQLDIVVEGVGIPAPVSPGDLVRLLDEHTSVVRDGIVDDVVSAPLLAVADVTAGVTAVAAIRPDGAVRTSSESVGSVGTVIVGTTELGGFDADSAAEQWNAVEAGARERLNEVLGSLGRDYEDTVMVRVMPRVFEETRLENGVAVAESSLSLLEVVVDPPSTAPDVDAPAEPDDDDQILDNPAGVSGGVAGVVLGAPEDDAARITLADMTARATHRRPGVEPRCVPACGSSERTLNRPWSPDGGFDVPAVGTPTSGELPSTGGTSRLLFTVALVVLTAAVSARAAPRTDLRRWSRAQEL